MMILLCQKEATHHWQQSLRGLPVRIWSLLDRQVENVTKRKPWVSFTFIYWLMIFFFSAAATIFNWCKMRRWKVKRWLPKGKSWGDREEAVSVRQSGEGKQVGRKLRWRCRVRNTCSTCWCLKCDHGVERLRKTHNTVHVHSHICTHAPSLGALYKSERDKMRKQ